MVVVVPGLSVVRSSVSSAEASGSLDAKHHDVCDHPPLPVLGYGELLLVTSHAKP